MEWDSGQVLPRSREERCQQSQTEYSVKGKGGNLPRGKLTMEEYTYGIARRESIHMDT